MTRHPTVHLFALCLDEARMIPYFLQHYNDLVSAFFIDDNGSTDGSLTLLRGDPRVTVREFRPEGDSFVDAAKRLQNSVWKTSRGTADWVVIVEMDEHLFHQDLVGYLTHCCRTGVTAVRSEGYNMFSEDFPPARTPLTEQVTRGVRFAMFDKLAIFRPDQIQEINYGAGRHTAEPQGNVVFEPQPQVKLLHYKHLGADYVCDRNAVLSLGLKEGDHLNDWGVHYRAKRRNVEDTFREFLPICRRVPGLAAQSGLFDLTAEDERWLIGASGLFDENYYSAQLTSRIDNDPMEHFATIGWRQNFRPNPLFDTAWYKMQYERSIPKNVNPLIEYILVGESQGHMPCVHFDPTKYRCLQRLPRHIGPLSHFLSRG